MGEGCVGVGVVVFGENLRVWTPCVHGARGFIAHRGEVAGWGGGWAVGAALPATLKLKATSPSESPATEETEDGGDLRRG